MFTIYPARLILAPQPERAACPAVEPPRARGFFLPIMGMAFGPPFSFVGLCGSPPSLRGSWQYGLVRSFAPQPARCVWWTPRERDLHAP